ncbi:MULTISPECIES: hypothetical protein [Streptomyces]|uniref:hypothetical protein n=1 Tax=Streptomyces TaxID=1883 RepID=UPI0013B414AC|nr:MULTISPECIES: hypothetical protein [Streptomyces]
MNGDRRGGGMGDKEQAPGKGREEQVGDRSPDADPPHPAGTPRDSGDTALDRRRRDDATSGQDPDRQGPDRHGGR